MRIEIKKQFGTYVSPDLVKKLQKDPSLLKLGGDTRELSILFSDLRGFTSISEHFKTNPQGLTELINRYLTPMTGCVIDHDGTVDKFIGDAIMAIFGTPVAHDDDPDRGLRAAIQMMHGLNEFNDIRKSQGLPPVDHGMGLNTDEIVSGNIGSPKRMDYTVIGDGVNLAARIESSCKKYGAKILMSEYTFKALKATYRTRQVDCVIVKGKSEPVHVFEVLDFHSKESFPNMIEVLEMFNNGIEYYNEGNWDKAIVQFKKAQNA